MDKDVALYSGTLQVLRFTPYHRREMGGVKETLYGLENAIKTEIEQIPYRSFQSDQLWIQEILAGDIAPTVALLLCLLPNLRPFSTTSYVVKSRSIENIVYSISLLSH